MSTVSGRRALSHLTDLNDVVVPGAVEGDMVYQNDQGLWVVVGGTKTDGDVPTVQADGSVAWGAVGGGASTPGWLQPFVGTTAGNDYYWQGSDFSDFTVVTISGSQIIDEAQNRVTVTASGIASVDINAGLKAHSFSIGDSFAVAMRGISVDTAHLGGILFTDGTMPSSNCFFYNFQHNVPDITARRGTLTAASTTTLFGLPTAGAWDWIWLRLTYEAADTFGMQISVDGENWISTIADTPFTMTPTHFGLGWSNNGQGQENQWVFGPLKQLV